MSPGGAEDIDIYHGPSLHHFGHRCGRDMRSAYSESCRLPTRKQALSGGGFSELVDGGHTHWSVGT